MLSYLKQKWEPKYSKAKAAVLHSWHGLPRETQAGIVVSASAAATALGDAAALPGHFWHWSVLRQALGAAIGAGIVAAKAFYMRPGPGAPAPAPAPADPDPTVKGLK